MSRETMHIVGGGLVGPLAAIFLAARGFDVVLYERRPDMRKENISAGRSINLVLTSRGLKALYEVGMHEEVKSLLVPVKGRMLHDTYGKTTFVAYGQKESEVIYSVSRGDLNKLLLTKAEGYPNVNIRFNHRCLSYDPKAEILSFFDESARQEVRYVANRVIGADGGGSILRKVLAEHVPDFKETADTLAHGYKELFIPPAAGGGYAISEQALHIWPRKNYMLMALPNLRGSFTVTLFFAHEGEESFAALKNEGDVQAFFQKTFPDAMAIMPTLAGDFFANPTGSMTTLRAWPWHFEDKLMLIGDASHAIVPFYGQGMNSGFEDCSALGRLLDQKLDWKTVFSRLEQERKPNADAIATLALENFVEMRDTVADPKFQLKKHIGFELEKRHPGKCIPRYAMVVFHPEIPYAEAKRRGDIQDRMLSELAQNITSVEQTNWSKAAELVEALPW